MKNELRVACTICVCTAGAAFSSGREAVSFFAGAGWASWIGIAAASVIFGLMCGMICHFANETGSSTLAQIYLRKMDARCGETMNIVHALLMLTMGASAVTTAGEIGMLTLDHNNAYIIAIIALIILAIPAALLRYSRKNIFAMAFLPMLILFFLALAIDKRPSRAGAYVDNTYFDIRGNVPVAIILGTVFAVLKAAMVGGIAAANSRGLSSAKFAIACGALMFLLTSSINLALQSAGINVWSLSLPIVVLSARWGIFGYYACAAFMWIGCLMVLSCAVSTLMSIIIGIKDTRLRALITIIAILCLSVTGLRTLISIGYPMLGWISAIMLGALCVFYERGSRRVKFREIG